MAYLALYALGKFTECPIIAVGYEQRVIAETAATARLVGNSPRADSFAFVNDLARFVSDSDNRDETSASFVIVGGVQLAEKHRHLLIERGAPVPGREDTGTSSERLDLEARVISKRYASGLQCVSARFQGCIFGKCRACFFDLDDRLQITEPDHFEMHIAKKRAELAQLALIACGYQ